MSTPCQPILANLKPSPLNVQSSQPLSSTASKKTSASVQSSTKSGASVQSGSIGKNDNKRKCTSSSNRHDTSLSGRTHKKLREEQDAAYNEHPYTLKLHTWKSKLQELLHKIFQLADHDILVCDHETGLNDYTKNLKFADELDDISKYLVGLSKECSQKAEWIRECIADAKEDKRLIQDIVYLQEVIKDTEKDDYVRLHRKDPVPYVPTSEFRVKHERVFFVDDPAATEEEIAAEKCIVQSGDPDTKFAFPKQNENDQLHHVDHICVECDKTLRDSQELWNHLSNHRKELYRCLKCPEKKFRTEASFSKHYKTHTGEQFPCTVCDSVFDMKSMLTNHMFTHTEEHLTCKKCGHLFKFQSSYLEHIRYWHLDTKTIECPVCHKMYWTPTAMRSHRYKKHGLVGELLYGEEKD